MRIDIHSHILPHMDDGASDVNESLELLGMLRDSGVGKVVLTPHFYRQNEDIRTFLGRRQASYEELCEAARGLEGCPELLLGAEVYFYPSLAEDPELGRLCTENTDYILLELPFEKFRDDFFRSFFNFTNRCRQNIILAHIERYLRFGNTAEDIAELIRCGDILCQMNCSSLAGAGFFRKKTLRGLISGGLISALGTDAHSVSGRPPMYSEAERIITTLCGREEFDSICARTEMILDNADPADVIGCRG